MLEERLTCHVLEKHVNEIHRKNSHSTRAVGGCGLEFITSFNILFSLILNICIYLFYFFYMRYCRHQLLTNCHQYPLAHTHLIYKVSDRGLAMYFFPAPEK